jgi:hypothetical protein
VLPTTEVNPVFINRLPMRISSPRSIDTGTPTGAFVAVPWALFCGTPGEPAVQQLWIYQAALNEARAVVRPSLPERDLLACWN